MKLRTGFVSNSSSSSFIIHKSAFKNENDMFELIKDLKKLQKNYNSRWGDPEKESLRKFSDYQYGDPEKEKFRTTYNYKWGDSEKTFEQHGNMLFIEFHQVPEVLELIKKYGISKDDPNVFLEYM